MKRVASNSAVLVGVNFTTAGFGFLLSIIVARALGVNDFGRYTLAFAWSFALGLFAEFGLNTLLTRDLAQHRSYTPRYFTAATLIKTGISLTLIAGVEIAAPQLSQDPHTVLAIRLAAPLIWLNAVFGSFTAIFRAFERMTPILFLNASSSLVQLGLTYVLVQRGGGLIAVIVLALAVQLAELGAACVILLTRFQIKPYSRIDWGLVRQLGRAAFPFAFAGLLGAIQVRANVLLLGVLQNEGAVGMLGAASRWAEAPKIIPNAFFGALFPALSFLANQRMTRLEETFRRSERALLAFAFMVALALTFTAAPLLTLTYGLAFAPAIPALQILGWLLVPALWNGVTVLYLYALGDEAFTNWISVTGLAIQLLTAIPLISYWGATGAALAALIGECAMVVPFRLRLAQKRRGIGTWQTAT